MLYFILPLTIDNISDRISKLNKLISTLKADKSKMLIIGASRTSDWNLLSQDSFLANHREYNLGKLSDIEIKHILHKLKVTNNLGILSEVSELEQVNIFNSVSERELLVALREITTGKKFDDIIANEYFSIKSDIAKEAYRCICMVHQFRYRIPQTLLLRILDVDLTKVFNEIFKYTEGIIYFEETRDKFDYLLSARHPVIANVVIKNFIKQDVEKFELLEKIFNNAIPSNPLEKSLVKKLYHNSTISDLFGDVTVGARCYELLSDQFPGDSYLIQQEALFYANHNQFNEAKNSIETALGMNPTSQIFKNTQGTILLKESLKETDMSKSAYLRDKGKDILLEAIKKSPFKPSPYHYHSLLSHLINWYRIVKPKEGEKEKLLLEIQDLLEKATREHPLDPNILVEAGRLQELLTNSPEAKKYFQKAIELSPRNMAARFLIAKILIGENELNQAYEICTEGCLLKEDEVLLNRLRFELMHKLGMDKGLIVAEYKKYLSTVQDDYLTKLYLGAFLYKCEDDSCTDIFVEVRNNPFMSSREKLGIVTTVERHLNSATCEEVGYVERFTPVGYLLKTERFKTRTNFYCHKNISGNLKNGHRLKCIVRFSFLGPVAVSVKKGDIL